MGNDEIPTFKIDNMVCTANLGMRFNLTRIVASSQKKILHVPKKNCVLMKLSNPSATALLFSSGKLVCSGLPNEDMLKNRARQFTQIIQQMDYPTVTLMDFKIQNIVGSITVPFRIKLEEFAEAYKKNVTYEPELSPAAIYRMKPPHVTIQLFVSGKIVLTGTPDENDIRRAASLILPIVVNFKDKKVVVRTTTTNPRRTEEYPTKAVE